MILINIFYDNLDMDNVFNIRLQLLNYLHKISKKRVSDIKCQDGSLRTDIVEVVFNSNRDNSSLYNRYGYSIIHTFECSKNFNISDIYSIIDKAYKKNKYYVLDKTCLRDSTITVETLHKSVKVYNLSEFDLNLYDSTYFAVFSTKVELNNFILKHIDSMLETIKIQVSLLEKVKKNVQAGNY